MLMRTLPAGRGRSLSGRPASSSRATRPRHQGAGRRGLAPRTQARRASASSPIRTSSGWTCGLGTAVTGRGTSLRSRTPCAPSPLPASCSTAKRSRTASTVCPASTGCSATMARRAPICTLSILSGLRLRICSASSSSADADAHKALNKAGSARRFSEHLEAADGEAMFRHACAMGLEGIVSKRARSRYKSGSCLSWVKVKNPAYERR